MRCLKRNQSTIYHAEYASKTAVTDTDNYETGEVAVTYSSPASAAMYVTSAKGASDVEIFGANLDYDRVLITDDLSCPITETSHIWVDTIPPAGHDYIVKRVSKSLNSVSIAIKKVV